MDSPQKLTTLVDEYELLDIKGVARFCGGISPWTVCAWLSQGKLTRVKIGSRTFVRKSQCQKLIDAGDGGKSAGRRRRTEEAV